MSFWRFPLEGAVGHAHPWELVPCLLRGQRISPASDWHPDAARRHGPAKALALWLKSLP
jgi:hypothetical protein